MENLDESPRRKEHIEYCVRIMRVEEHALNSQQYISKCKLSMELLIEWTKYHRIVCPVMSAVSTAKFEVKVVDLALEFLGVEMLDICDLECIYDKDAGKFNSPSKKRKLDSSHDIISDSDYWACGNGTRLMAVRKNTNTS